MANELRVSGTANFIKGGASLSRQYSISVTVAGTNMISAVQSIATTDTSVGLGAVGTIGYVVFKNLDATNYIDVGSDGSVYPIRLMAGESAGPLRWNGAAIHAKAHTAACLLQSDIIEA
jgi:hypothetical protein